VAQAARRRSASAPRATLALQAIRLRSEARTVGEAVHAEREIERRRAALLSDVERAAATEAREPHA
jgi:F0F1-type ATP synthase membrane subunit b/b'